jgi:hypothetical protein
MVSPPLAPMLSTNHLNWVQDQLSRFHTNELDPVRIYKKCSADKEEKQYRTVPPIMRLSILALFIALPAAAYAAVTPRKESLAIDIVRCPSDEQTCPDGNGCCRIDCTTGKVCIVTHLL